MKVIVVGGGIVGCSAAYFAARAGAEVTLLEREHVAFGASGRNPGFVWLHCRNPGFALEISLASRTLYPQLVDELPEDFGFRPNGGLIYFTTPEQGAVFEAFVEERRRDGLDVDLVDGAEVRRLVPPIREDVLFLEKFLGHRMGPKTHDEYIHRNLTSNIYHYWKKGDAGVRDDARAFCAKHGEASMASSGGQSRPITSGQLARWLGQTLSPPRSSHSSG